jgi:predicted GIY-YIG superfamily endonuclease
MEKLILKILNEIISEQKRAPWSEEEIRKEAQKYQTPKEFHNNSGSAYNAAKRFGDEFFDEITSHMISKRKNKWKPEELEQLAKQYQTRSEFHQNNVGAYDASKNFGQDFFERITSHMTSGREKPRKYTDDVLRDLISKYTTLKQFRDENPQAYAAILSQPKSKRDEFYKNIEISKVGVPKNYTPNDLITIAKKYDKVTDFWKFDKTAAQYAKKIGQDFFDKITSHMEFARRDNLTNDDILQIAKQYTSLNDFNTKDPALAKTAKSRGIFDVVTSHMERKQVKRSYDSIEKLVKQFTNLRDFRNSEPNAYAWVLTNLDEKQREELFKDYETLGSLHKRLIYAFEFPDRSVYVGLTFDPRQRAKSHKESVKSQVKKHMDSTGLEPKLKYLSDYVSQKEAQTKERQFISKYKTEGWNVLNRAKGGALGSIVRIWDLEKVKQIASNYTNSRDFRENDPQAYGAANANGWYKEITKHFTPLRKHKWTVSELKQITSQYNSLQDFRKNEPSAYQTIVNRKLLDKFTSHMEKDYRYLTDDEIISKSKNYNRLIDLIKNDPSLYNIIRRRELQDKLFDKMEKRVKWTPELVKQEALKYNRMSDFVRTPAYQAARRFDILKDVTSHIEYGKSFGINKNK